MEQFPQMIAATKGTINCFQAQMAYSCIANLKLGPRIKKIHYIFQIWQQKKRDALENNNVGDVACQQYSH
jgi:hypothetical protein